MCCNAIPLLSAALLPPAFHRPFLERYSLELLCPAKLTVAARRCPSSAFCCSLPSQVPYVVTGDYVYVAGQLPVEGGQVHTGRVPSEKSIEQAYESARLSGLNVVAQLKAACNGDLTKVKRIVKLVGYVQSDADFQQHAAVIDGASDLMTQVFGEAGRPARSAVGSYSLQFGATTQVEAVVEVEVTSAFGPGYDQRSRGGSGSA